MQIQRLLSFLTAAFLLTHCDLVQHREFHDPLLELKEREYRALTLPPEKSPEKVEKELLELVKPLPSDPIFQKPLLTPAMNHKVSVSIHENIPLKDVFSELARQAGVGLALSPQLNGASGIVYSAHQTPFIHVVEDICELSNLRFQISGNLVRIEPDTPYLLTYDLQFLTSTRSNETQVNVTTDVSSILDAKGRQDKKENGSEIALKANTSTDFWAELEHNLRMILNDHNKAQQHHFTVHKQGGLISVRATAREHALLADYFQKLKQTTATQVLIEAKLVEVSLKNDYKSGINWNQLGGAVNIKGALGDLSTPGPYNPEQINPRDVFTFAVKDDDFSSVVNLLKKFGTLRTLSNPRITVLNNQSSVLKVATNEVFFQLDFETVLQGDDGATLNNVKGNILTIPIGMIMMVQPSINHKTREIALTLRPTITRVERYVDDPSVAIQSNQQVRSRVPVVQVREIDTVLRLKSNEAVVIGGLMEDRSSNESASVPVADSIPILGELARGKDDERQMTELVIFLTARILDEPFIADADERLYNTYVEDPRPLDLKNPGSQL